MTRVTGTVIAVRDGRAWIECRAEASGCGPCAQGRGCGWFRAPRARQLETAAEVAGTPLVPGDAVELEADEGRLLVAAARLYLPPLAGLIAGPALLRWSGLEAGVAPLVAAAVGLVAGAMVARAWTRAGAPVRLIRA